MPTSPLTDVEVRVLGALLEKEATTPDTYPLSLAALVAACNQTTNREPVMQLDEATVSAAAATLRGRGLVRSSTPMGSRVTKYEHVLAGMLGLGRGERAVLAVLLLRGAQTAGELHSRTARLADFGGLDQVEGVLEALIAREKGPLVARLPRRPGQKETRYAQTLGGTPEHAADVPEARDTDDGAPGEGRVAALERRVEEMAAELAVLRAQMAELRVLLE